MGLPKRDDQLHTYADYLTWGDDQRWELIDGVAYAMSAPSPNHQRVVGEVYRQLANALVGKPCEAFVSPLDVRIARSFARNEDVTTVVQPDVLVVCDGDKIDARGVKGGPDLVVEVLSPSTTSHDHIRKRRVYEQAGVRELWFVSPRDRIVMIYRLEQGKYGQPEVQELEGETAVGVLDGVAVQWATVVERLPPVEP